MRWRDAAQVAVLTGLLEEAAARLERRPSGLHVYTPRDFLPWGWMPRGGTARVALGVDTVSAMVGAQREADSANAENRLAELARTIAIPEIAFGLMVREDKPLSGLVKIHVPCVVGGRPRRFRVLHIGERWRFSRLAGRKR
jgi:hypothetical protein